MEPHRLTLPKRYLMPDSKTDLNTKKLNDHLTIKYYQAIMNMLKTCVTFLLRKCVKSFWDLVDLLKNSVSGAPNLNMYESLLIIKIIT